MRPEIHEQRARDRAPLLARLRELGATHTANEIGEILDMAPSRVRQLCAKHGLPKPKPHGPSEARQAVLETFAEHGSYADAGAVLGVSRQAIFDHVRRATREPIRVSIDGVEQTVMQVFRTPAGEAGWDLTKETPRAGDMFAIKVGRRAVWLCECLGVRRGPVFIAARKKVWRS